MNPKISILLPTRNSINSFETTIMSLYKSCSNKSQLEIIVRLDLDDNIINKYISFLKTVVDINYKIIIGHTYLGYQTLNFFTQEMTRVSTGDLLWLYGDDITMHNCDWYSLMSQAWNKTNFFVGYIINRKGSKSRVAYEFPIVSRKLYNMLSSVISPYRDSDTYLSIVSNFFKSGTLIDGIIIGHDRSRSFGGHNRRTDPIGSAVDVEEVHTFLKKREIL